MTATLIPIMTHQEINIYNSLICVNACSKWGKSYPCFKSLWSFFHFLLAGWDDNLGPVLRDNSDLHPDGVVLWSAIYLVHVAWLWRDYGALWGPETDKRGGHETYKTYK